MNDGIKTMIRSRLTFNSMFSPIDKFILGLNEEDYNKLLAKADEKLQELQSNTRARGFSLGKRNLDNILIDVMREHCVSIFELEKAGGKELLENARNRGEHNKEINAKDSK